MRELFIPPTGSRVDQVRRRHCRPTGISIGGKQKEKESVKISVSKDSTFMKKEGAEAGMGFSNEASPHQPRTRKKRGCMALDLI